MKILAISRDLPNNPVEDYQAVLHAEAMRAWELHMAGVIRELYFHADGSCAVLVMECGSVDEARQALDTLPLVQTRQIDFDYLPLVAYSGFDRLFARHSQAVQNDE